MWIVSSRAHRKQIVSTRADSSGHSIAPPNPEPIVSRAGVSRAGVSAASCRTIEIDRALPTRAVLELSRAKQRAELPALGLCCSATHSIAQQRESHICAPGSMSRLPRCQSASSGNCLSAHQIDRDYQLQSHREDLTARTSEGVVSVLRFHTRVPGRGLNQNQSGSAHTYFSRSDPTPSELYLFSYRPSNPTLNCANLLYNVGKLAHL